VPVFVSGAWARLKRNPEQVGMADVIGCLPPDGKLLWLECKTGNARQTPAQEARADAFARGGALVVVAGSVAELMAALHFHVPHSRVVALPRRAG